MKYYIDTEFIDAAGIIDLISIAVICEDGREFYAENVDCDLSRANEWLHANVIPQLSSQPVLHRDQIRSRLNLFISEDPELYGWCCAYDYVILCQLFGTMMNIPTGWPHYMRDLQQELDKFGLSDEDLPRNVGTNHHALYDARYIRYLWDILPLLKGRQL